MYSASATFLTKIKASARKITWSGTVKTTGGTTYSLSLANIIQGSITRGISSQSLDIGTAYASTLNLEVVLSGVSRYELYGAEVSLSCSVEGALDVIPMGKYTISEAMQSADHITIKAYDNMVKFDSGSFLASSNSSIMLPYNWLTSICSACGVTFGMTKAQVEALPNGLRKTGFADTVSDVKTYRDVLGYLAAYLNSYAYIDRSGELQLGQYDSVSDDTIPANFRFSSGLSDFRTTYDGLHADYKETETVEYVSNTNTNGIVLEMGVNPFLQFSNDTNRLDALQEIIDGWDGVYYVPYQSEIPLMPTYDPGDILTFTGNQASTYDLGAITEITYNIGGTMSVTCGGDNPILAEAQDRFTKSVSSLSNDSTNGQEIGDKDFWLLFVTNNSALTVGSTETQIAEIEFEQKTYAQNVEMILTVDCTLSASAVVNIRVNVDDETDLEMNVTESKSFAGERVFHCSNPQKVIGEGTHTAKVYMTVTDSAIQVGELF